MIIVYYITDKIPPEQILGGFTLCLSFLIGAEGLADIVTRTKGGVSAVERKDGA
jgi:hypothetical protein